ncbi:hypothetical protein FWG86_02110 [Candidatus Saccharibacteria bacterium]|nr:hypothetical protein [Candidatus Saccharibacteria bacterium]
MTIQGPSTGNLTLANQVITNTTGTITTPAIFSNSIDTSNWGFAIPSSQVQGITNGFDSSYSILGPANANNTAKFASVPSTATPISSTTAANPTADNYDFFFAVSSGSYMPTGTYTGKVIISALGNAAMPPSPLYLQAININNCPVVRTMAVDARDNHTYWVRKITGTGAGGTDLCWMETNLAYAGGGTNTYGDTINGMTLGTGANIASGQACYGDNATMNTNGQGCFWEPTGSNITAGATEPSTSTTGTGQYGYLYNWCAAMGGQASACQTSTATQPDTTINVCPAGWRLPTGPATTGEFTLLNNLINSGSTSSPSGLFNNGLYMYAGTFYNGSFSDQGSGGYYWSSTVSSAANAFRLYFTSSNVAPASANIKGYGRSVRCVNDSITAAEPLPPPVPAPTGSDIQRITLEGTPGNYSCPITRTRVRDARDGSTYWVRRINSTQSGGGDLCWMETNLAYKGGGTNTYGDTMTITAGTSIAGSLNANSTGSSSVCYGNNDSMNTNGQGCFWEPTGSNITVGATNPSTSTTGTGQYGVLYNWCAAMGNQSAACQTGAATQPDTTINVCPSGWRLPTGQATTGEFTLLNNTLNSGSTSSPTGLFTNGLYMYAGAFNYGSFGNQGSYGYYWSSTVSSTTTAFSLYFSSSSVSPAATVNKGAGFSVRCVAP